jgi:hypothetical protein
MMKSLRIERRALPVTVSVWLARAWTNDVPRIQAQATAATETTAD